MEGFTQFCVWFLFICAVSELSWKGWKYYKNRDVEVSNTESEFVFTIKPNQKAIGRDTNKEELEAEKKNKD